ncbi:rifin PIR protein, putative [Plasmodium reichenowi]|uniref:Rifin PIR protein, putative n=1 Tax=Plasmodium reichenowi TaxID=5854 RepID=A0A2P9DCA0_PLARE|nr:rifin PIR protein, putative [Plasmodium reichenowi]
MKIHYINILLFDLPLNILVHNQRNHKSTTPHHIPKIPTTRLLCECEVYEPANYDNDLEMKRIMENFDRQTSQRLRDYDERMKTTRQKCKEQCDKEIQKIILKDKLEKELMDKFATLQTDIQSDAIPTCICEKSLADKTETFCLNCGKNMGGVAPSWGLVSGIVYTGWKAAALVAAKAEALAEATDLATKAGMNAVISIIERSRNFYEPQAITGFISIVNEKNFYSASALKKSVEEVFGVSCKSKGGKPGDFCHTMVAYSEESTYKPYVQPGIAEFEKTLSSQKVLLEARNMGAVEATYASYQTAIIASIIAIVVIILVMLIIYLILRYRRKKKMKKKLQYIKLLEE